ncbi:MAG TPA: hypothetical protein DEF42_05405 [Desulfosporosinus sp.]|nr:hypothetical protein [Desulfosporosinus sp.]
MNLEELRLNCAIKQKKGLHFILASIIIWCIILIIHSTSLPYLTKNLFTFCSTAPCPNWIFGKYYHCTIC